MKNMEEQSIFRVPPSSSALVALSSLVPPSPILSPNELPSSFTSGHIPIYFDLDADALPSTGFCSLQEHIQHSSSIGTFGTFGPTCRKLGVFGSALAKRDTISSSSTELAEDGDGLSVTPVFETSLESSTFSSAFYSSLTPSAASSHLTNQSLTPEDSQFLTPRSQLTAFSPTTEDNSATLALDDPVRKMAIAAALACLESRCDSAPSSPLYKHTHFPRSEISSSKPVVDLPKNLLWLIKTTVEMLVDQEGFRGVIARFKFSGFNGKQSLASLKNTSDIAHFLPAHRQAFVFHYAPLEGLPVLRRITLNGDETRDYCSKQASLRLKTNGVYVVRGTELSALSELKEGDVTPESKLHWKLEYFVDDRRVDASGNKIVDGEKLLTPLSFSCSPLLLHPLQGKRIRLMQVMKKAVAPNLVAEKMEPPDFWPNADVAKTPPETPPVSPRGKSYVWSVHHWAATHWPFIQDTDRKLAKVSVPILIKDSDPLPNLARRRRASSAGEHSRPGVGFPTRRRDYDISPTSHCPPPGTHIIPPSRLTQMLDTACEEAQA